VDKPLNVLYLTFALLVNKRNSRTFIFIRFLLFFLAGKSGQIAGGILYFEEGG
jgi:hypothetical protein